MKKVISSFVLLLLISCSKSTETENFTNQTITPILIAKGQLMGSENILPQNVVYYNSADWNNTINLIDQFRLANFTETTNVDFNTYQLIAVFDEVYGNPTNKINISSIAENLNNITVTVEKIYQPSIATVMTQEFHIVKIPKSSKPVIFQ